MTNQLWTRLSEPPRKPRLAVASASCGAHSDSVRSPVGPIEWWLGGAGGQRRILAAVGSAVGGHPTPVRGQLLAVDVGAHDRVVFSRILLSARMRRRRPCSDVVDPRGLLQ